MSSDIWYFAYASNLSLDRKQQPTGSIRSARIACLKDYRFAFNKGGAGGEVYANIVPSPGDVVWGVVYLCEPQAMASLGRIKRSSSFPALCVQVEPMEHEIDDGGKNESGHEDQHQPAIEGIAASEELAS